MKKRILLVSILTIILITAGNLNAREHSFNVDNESELRPSYISHEGINLIEKPGELYRTLEILDEEILAESEYEEEILPREYFAFKMDPSDSSIEIITPEYALSDTALLAIEQAPKWLRASLRANMRELTVSSLDGPYAKVIVEAPEHLKDEIAFQYAHIARRGLTNARFMRDYQMPRRNAELIYALADSLEYVRLVEHEGDDYYTTCEYKVVDEGDTIWVEIPKDIYYWYIVHPKLSDEGVYSSDDAGSSQQRTYDYFWREFLWFNPHPDFDYTDGGEYRMFNEHLKQCKVLWGREPIDRANTDTTLWAAAAVGTWVSSMMPGEPSGPRPIQPNQLAIWHRGNCGEGQDISGAALRTALIPNLNISNIAEDHVWNEFYDEDWIFYQVDNHGGTTHLASGWAGYDSDHGGSKDISTVWAYRGDGYLMQVSERYTAVCTLIVNVQDIDGNPVDGAYILIANESYYDETSLTYSTLCWTDCNGQVVLPIGQNQNYYIRVESPYGNFPPGEDMTVNLEVEDSELGEVYETTVSLTGSIFSVFEPNEMEEPSDGDFGMRVNFEIDNLTVGENEVLDSQRSQFRYNSGAGKAQVFVCDDANLSRYERGLSFDAYYLSGPVSGGMLEAFFPDDGIWYVVFANSECTTNRQKVNANIDFISSPVFEDTKEEMPEQLAIGSIYPNPFNSAVSIDIENADLIEIYDIDGHLVYRTSESKFTWQPGNDLPSGIYKVIAKSDGEERAKNIVFIK
ncbi:MAG: T9SS type A sorting domain-containing protein [Candidatus Zixiibacteriota bacterium]